MEIINQEVQSTLYNYGFSFWLQIGLLPKYAHILNSFLLLLALAVLLYFLDYLLNRVLIYPLIKKIRKSSTQIDDYLIRNGVVRNIIHFIPLLIARVAIPTVFAGFPRFTQVVLQAVDLLLIFTITVFIKSLAYTLKDILSQKRRYADKPLGSYFQVISIALYSICAAIIITKLMGIAPKTILGGLGAASAIIILVFRDTILGFVASIQVSSNDMVRLGDWIEMNKFGADGIVKEINLSTVKVQNFDNTITTIPTYALISDSFKNFRGMQKSGGRRIKRTLQIKIGSIRFLEDNEIENLKRIKYLKSYILEREQEINEYNRKNVDDPTMPVNGRRMTNIGLFREYVQRYLLNNPNIHKRFVLMVRQMQTTQHGLPLEIYAFTKTTDLVAYERIMADVFDHIFAVVPFFHLEVFESPASNDIRKILIEKKYE